MLVVGGFGVDDWWGCVVTSLVPPTTPDGASERRLWGRRLRGVGGVLINPLPTAYHEHRPSEGNEISAICARWKLRDFVSESGGDCDRHINVLLSSL